MEQVLLAGNSLVEVWDEEENIATDIRMATIVERSAQETLAKRKKKKIFYKKGKRRLILKTLFLP